MSPVLSNLLKLITLEESSAIIAYLLILTKLSQLRITWVALIILFFIRLLIILLLIHNNTLLMGNCGKSTPDKQISCPLQNKNSQLNKAGQLYNFKKTLASEDNKKQLNWDGLFSAKESQRDDVSSKSSSQRKIPGSLENCQPLKNSNSMNRFKENNVEPATKNEMGAKLTAKQLSYQLTKENIENMYENGLSFQKLVIEDEEQQLPRPQAKIIKKSKKQVKYPPNEVTQRESKLKVQLTKNQRQTVTEQNKQLANSEPSIIACLENEQKFQGIFVQDHQSSRIKFRVSASNIQFVLPKVRAGPLIVSQIDYDYYTT